jgi:hypothetical protein
MRISFIFKTPEGNFTKIKPNFTTLLLVTYILIFRIVVNILLQFI